jgi:hypothetical protein
MNYVLNGDESGRTLEASVVLGNFGRRVSQYAGNHFRHVIPAPTPQRKMSARQRKRRKGLTRSSFR